MALWFCKSPVVLPSLRSHSFPKNPHGAPILQRLVNASLPKGVAWWNPLKLKTRMRSDRASSLPIRCARTTIFAVLSESILIGATRRNYSRQCEIFSGGPRGWSCFCDAMRIRWRHRDCDSSSHSNWYRHCSSKKERRREPRASLPNWLHGSIVTA